MFPYQICWENRYIYNTGPILSYRAFPTTINPYIELNINKYSSLSSINKAFFNKIFEEELKLINNNNDDLYHLPNGFKIYVEQKVSYSYDILSYPEKYNKIGDLFTVKEMDSDYYTAVGDAIGLRKEIEKNPNIVFKKDKFGRTLLHKAAMNGYYYVCLLLLIKGAKIDEVEINGDTALHISSYYGHEFVVKLLISYYANTNIKNNSGYSASMVSRTEEIKNLINNCSQDKIFQLYNELKNSNLASEIVPIFKTDDKNSKKEIIAYKIICINKDLFNKIDYKYESAWHGTKYKNLKSIAKNGLCAPGTKLKDGTEIKPTKGHIQLGFEVDGKENWAKAVFVSPDIFYAADACYSERIISQNEQWVVLIETRVKPGSYDEHNSTLLRHYDLKTNEPEKVEYRVKVEKDEKLIYRVRSEEKNIYVVSIVFVLAKFIENLDDIYESYISKKKEKILLRYLK